MEERITLAWKDICVYVPFVKAGSTRERHHRFQCIVHNVTGVAYPGELIAILGSPMLANSMLLQVLGSKASSNVSITGQIVVNGMETSSIMSKISGYVERNDVFYQNITVEEHLNFQSKLRMDKRLSGHERRRRVQQLLDEFDLNKSRHMKIKSISNILKIRLSLVAEMLNDPPILFCDDLTADMDSAETINLVQGLRDIANSGITVIITARQLPTESLDDFDQIMLLTEGNLAFFGTPRNAERFFESLDFVCPKYFDVVDYFLYTLGIRPGREQECRQQVRDICLSNNSSSLTKALANRVDLEIDREVDSLICTVRSIQHPSLFKKSYFLVRRLFRNYFQSHAFIFQAFQIVVTGALIGLCFFGIETETQYGVQATKGFLFVLVNESVFRPLWSSWKEGSLDLQIFRREYKFGLYDARAFMISKMCFTFPVSAVQTLFLTGISYGIAYYGKTRTTVFLVTWLITFVTTITSHAFALAFKAVFDKYPRIAKSVLNPVHLLLMVTSGTFISMSTTLPGISWIRFASWMFYSYKSLVTFYLENIPIHWCRPDPNLPCYKSGNEVLSEMGLENDHLGIDMFFTVVLYAIFNIIAYAAIMYRLKKS